MPALKYHMIPALLAVSALNSAAQNTAPQDPVHSIGEVVVTATRDAEVTNITAPNTVHSVTPRELAERLPRTVAEALREIPGVHVQKTSNGQGSPFIRGFTGFRNLALIDGVRFNNSTFREGPNQYWSTIDPFSLDHIELIPTQGSVLYGSDAIGGTLNVFSKDSGWRDAEAGRSFSGGQAIYRGSSAENSHSGRVEYHFGEGGKWGLHLGATVRDFGDVEAADIGRQSHTGYDEWAYDARLDYAIDDNWTFTAVHQKLTQDDVWRTHSTIYGEPWQGTTIGTDRQRSFDQERTLSYVRVAGDKLDGFADSAALTLSYQTACESQYRIKASRASDLGEVDLDTFGVDLQFTSDTSIGRFTYGADYYRDEVDSASTFWKANGTFDKYGIQGPVGDDSTYDLFGLFVQDEITASDSLHIFLGGRYTYAQADIGRYEDPVTRQPASQSDDWSQFSASARAVLDLDAQDHWQLYGGVSQGFRAPNLSDLSRLDIARSGELETAAPGLDPEEFLNFELGVRTQREGLNASLVYFYTDINDLIVRKPTGNMVGSNVEVTKANGGDGFVQGVELAADYAINDNWSLFGSVAWTEGEVDQYPTRTDTLVREPMSRIVPLIAHGGVRWQRSDRKFWAELAFTAASKADKLNTADRADTQRIPPGGTPGYTLVNLRGGWKVNENVSLTASLDNLLDEDWRSHGSGSNEPGFGGTVGVTVSF